MSAPSRAGLGRAAGAGEEPRGDGGIVGCRSLHPSLLQGAAAPPSRSRPAPAAGGMRGGRCRRGPGAAGLSLLDPGAGAEADPEADPEAAGPRVPG